MKQLSVTLDQRSYDILIKKASLQKLSALVSLSRNVLVVTDEGAPENYAQTVLSQCKNAHLLCVKQGEESKSFAMLQQICETLLRKNFTRKDLVIAVGGGVVGDLAGMAASIYMRGIAFVNIPTTTLAQIDSSIGGKTAINLLGIKNVVGTFYQPSFVLIDPDVLCTLPKRHFNAGMIEALKAGLLADPQLVALFEKSDFERDYEEMAYRAILVKKDIVEKDEREHNIRAYLNFGHTIGHGIESAEELHGLLHGECVAIGMLPMILDGDLKRRVEGILKKLSMPLGFSYDKKKVMHAIVHDKKTKEDSIETVQLKGIGEPMLKKMTIEEIEGLL